MKAALRWDFIGSSGIRAGRRVLLFLGIVILVQLLLGLAARVFGFRQSVGWRELAPDEMIPAEALNFSLVLVAALAMARIERKGLAAYG
jgi:hypothetical protein